VPWLVLGLVLIVLGGGAAVLLAGDEGDVSNPDVRFDATTEDAPVAPDDTTGRHPADDGFEWPLYGFTKARTHVLQVRRQLRPPFRAAWAERGRVLLEFAPVICGRSLFLLKNNGALYSISRLTGHVRWKRKLGTLAAASPACGHGSVYAVVLERTRGSGAGRVASLSTRTGRTRWSRKLPSRAESSPLLDRGRLYFGTEDGTVYGLRASNGAVRWRYQADGAVKGGLALDNGKLYFGDYGGKVHAIRRSDGGKVWEKSTSGSRFGLSSGNFYATPAVAYGRVYIGNTDGNVYSYSSSDGALAWRMSTGDYVYAGAAVGQVAGGRPTVWVGSYDGKFRALDARSGRVRWTRSLGTKISGSATVVGDLVFVSDLDRRSTWALGANTGATVWKTHRGAFNPAISDGRRIYLNGYSSLFGLDPRGGGLDRKGSPGAQRRARADRAARAKRARDRRAARAVRAARRKAARARLARNRARAAHRRSLKLRFAPHGHHHTGTGPPPRCHPHTHVYKVGSRTIVLRHNHCHTHVRGKRVGR
jgi:outer membrane protein assembly factor BamB